MAIEMFNRVVPYAIMAAAVAVHFHYCQWDVRSTDEPATAEQYQRAIYFDHSLHREIFLLAKSVDKRREAQLYGVVFPIGAIAIAVVLIKLYDDPVSTNRRTTEYPHA